LEEIKEADLLIHVLDVSDQQYYQRAKAVYDILKQLNVEGIPIITALNKIDLLSDMSWIERIKSDFSYAVAISAKKKENIDTLLETICFILSALRRRIVLYLPLKRLDLLNLIYSQGEVKEIKYLKDFVKTDVVLPEALAKKLEYLCQKEKTTSL
jgi:GTP-binding protein HflX